MIKESDISNTQIPESQSPSSVDDFDVEKKKVFEDIFYKDEINIDKIISISNKKQQKLAINSHIGQILNDFNNGQKTREDFDQMMKRLVAIAMNGAVYQKEASEERKKQVGEFLFNKDRSWSQAQIDEIIDYFEKYESNEASKKEFSEYNGNYFWEIFTTSRKEKKEQNTVSDLVAKHLVKRIERGGRLSEALQKEVQDWCQNIQMIDSDVRLDFLSAILNNPGKVNSYTTEEAIGHMGLYGPGFIRQLEDNLEKSSKNIGKALKVVTILNHLRHKRSQVGFEDSGDEALKILYEIRDGADNYFIKTKATQVLKKPLEDYTIKEKRVFLKDDWKNIIQPDSFYDTIQPVLGESDPYEAMRIDPMDETMLLDQEVDAIFDRYRYVAGAYYYWNEREQMKDRYEDEGLRKRYNIIPQTAEYEYHKDEITREACYTKVNNKYGVIYTPSGRVDSFFEFSPELEAQAQEEKEKNGDITENTLEFFVNKFEKALISEEAGQFLYYLQIRNKLPKELQNKIDSYLKLEIPKELDKEFSTKVEFENELEKHKEKLLEDLSDSQDEKTSFLTSELKNLLNRRKQVAKEKHFGYSSENIDLLDFFNSFNRRHPNRVHPTVHHTICYYLYLRKDLPENLVQEFEEKFNVKVPDNLKEFDTFDDYLATPDKDLLMPFTYYPNFHEMSAWLNQHIDNLSEKIKKTKKTPERLTISDILEKEGFKKEKMSEEEYDKLLLTYKTLIELPIRESIEKDFEIKLSDYSVREQVQFVNFLSTKTIEEVEKVKKFLGNKKNEQSIRNKVKSFLSLEQDPGMGEVILSIGEQLEDEPEVADRLFTQYAEMVDGAESMTEAMIQASVNSADIDKNKIIDNILFEAKKLLDSAYVALQSQDLKENFFADLKQANTRVLLLNKVIKQLPREEVATLDLRQIENINRREDMLASELFQDKKTLEQIKSIIKVQFPEGDDAIFQEECKNDKDLRLTITMVNNEVVSFFSKKRMANNVDYIDWFISNPDAPVEGLGEATLRLGFKENNKTSYYAVAKPYVKSFNIFVEKLGFVSFGGSTLDGEYKDHYVRVRKIATDKDLETKKISEASLNSLINSVKTICLEKNKVESYLYQGKKLDVCKVEFSGQTHKDDILETDQDGWIMAEIRRQYEKGNVLTRYISESNAKDNQIYYAVFEEDNAGEEDIVEINKVVSYKTSVVDDQLDSKKALSN